MEKKSKIKSQRRSRISRKKKQEIIDWLEINSYEIQTGELAVFFEDECHLLWGDTCGYIWGKKEERVEIAMINERIRQTYYGAVNILNQKCISKKYERGNSKNTIDFIKYLLSENKGSRIAIIWDGASYHRSEEIREYFEPKLIHRHPKVIVNHENDTTNHVVSQLIVQILHSHLATYV